ncbi:unnamed protein product [Allacma fusca]|uniref:G-protein coupled receptors family 1 profile domain-containing protein n=1 Tax=Allacma fusca TaxID=39272 RepID=A0A8J2PTS6_9HEXA|nr:unnamed protein product [Allacma fusca]
MSSSRRESVLFESLSSTYWPLLPSSSSSASSAIDDQSVLPPGENQSFFNDSFLGTTNEPHSSLWTLHHPALAILLLSFCVATVFGNVLVIVAVARERYLHSVTNYFITSLAVADCLVGFVVMPFQAIYEVLDKKWIFGELWCDLWHSLDVLASTASILNLCVISLDRYWAITDPFTYPSRMTNSKACLLIALVWVCSSLISFPAIAWWRAVRDNPIQDLECPFTDDLGYLVFSSIISFYGPLFVMVFTYYRIYRVAVEQTRSLKQGTKQVEGDGIELTLRIHRGGGANSHPPPPHDNSRHIGNTANYGHQRRQPAQQQNSSDGCDSDVGHIALLSPHPNDNGSSSTLPRNNSVRVVPKNLKNFSISRKLAKFAKEKKAAKTLGIVIGVFIVCWCPFFITNLLSGICKTCLNKAQLMTEVALWGGWINSGMNPVIYACWSRDFRRAFGRIVCVCCPGRIRRQYRPGGLRPHLARLTQLSLRTAMPFDDQVQADDFNLSC